MAYYQENAINYFNETCSLNTIEKSRNSFLSYLDEGCHILDLGCGSGRDSLYFKQHGYEVTALDMSEELAELASTFIGQPVVVGSYHTMNYIDQFDAVWACASLLHTSKKEIGSVFENIIRSLKKKGVWYMSFKQGSGETVDMRGRFFNNYTVTSLEKLVRKFDQLTILDSWVESNELRGKQQKWVGMMVRKKAK